MVSPVRTKSYKLSLETAAAVPVSARATRTPAGTTATVASSAKGTAVPGSVILRTRTRRTNRLRQNFQVRGNHHDLPYRTFAHALAPHVRFIAQRQVQNAPFTAVHGAEVERHARFLDAFRCGLRAHAQLLNPQHTMIVGIETQERMLLWSHAQRLGSQLLNRQQKFRLVGKQQFYILTSEAYQNVWVLEVWMHGFAGAHGIGQRKASPLDEQIKELPDTRLRFRKRELL